MILRRLLGGWAGLQKNKPEDIPDSEPELQREAIQYLMEQQVMDRSKTISPHTVRGYAVTTQPLIYTNESMKEQTDMLLNLLNNELTLEHLQQMPMADLIDLEFHLRQHQCLVKKTIMNRQGKIMFHLEQ